MANKNINIERGDSYVPTASQLTAEEITYGWDFSREATRRGTTVSSAEWSNEYGDTMTISGESLTAGLTTANLSSTHAGNSIVRTTCTFADGTRSAKCLKVTVLDPKTDSFRGYC